MSMEDLPINDSAHRHGATDDLIRFLMEHVEAIGYQDYDEEIRLVFVCRDSRLKLWEIVVRPAFYPAEIIHAMRATRKTLTDYYPEGME